MTPRGHPAILTKTWRASLLLIAILLAATPVGAQPGGPLFWLSEGALQPTDLTPLQFLDVLRERRDTPRGVRVWNIPPDWVRRDDVPALLALARSEEVVAVTCSVVAAHAPPPDARSTLDREAMRLIEGYRRGLFPTGCSNLAPPADPDELERWWAAGGARKR